MKQTHSAWDTNCFISLKIGRSFTHSLSLHYYLLTQRFNCSAELRYCSSQYYNNSNRINSNRDAIQWSRIQLPSAPPMHHINSNACSTEIADSDLVACVDAFVNNKVTAAAIHPFPKHVLTATGRHRFRYPRPNAIFKTYLYVYNALLPCASPRLYFSSLT